MSSFLFIVSSYEMSLNFGLGGDTRDHGSKFLCRHMLNWHFVATCNILAYNSPPTLWPAAWPTRQL